MKIKYFVFLLLAVILVQCKNKPAQMDAIENAYKILFLHHSTGYHIWQGNSSGMNLFSDVITVPDWFTRYNEDNGTNYYIREQTFPKAEPYGWNNYPYDYYNIWVKNGGDKPYKEEPTLEMLTKDNNMIIFKHCFPISSILEDTGEPDVNSSEKRLENYILQYDTLKSKLHTFPDTKFIVWTGAALTAHNNTEDRAERARKFFTWVKEQWDEPDDNIYLWDFYELETEGGNFLKNEYAVNRKDSHPDRKFSARAAQLFSQRIVDVIENNGTQTKLTGEYK